MIRVPPALIFLVLAWLCANRPQGFVTAVVQWCNAVGTFSHQAQLAGELRAVLAQTATQPDSDATAVAEAPKRETTNESPPAALPAPGFQKLELALPGGVQVPVPIARRHDFVESSKRADSHAREVPVPVPREVLG